MHGMSEAPVTAGRVLPVARRLHAFACGAATLFSLFFWAHDLLMLGQHFLIVIPAGSVEQVEPAKGGVQVALDGGRIAHFPGDILRSHGIQLGPGDRVSKDRGSLTYQVNGRAAADAASVARRSLADPVAWSALGVYLTVSVAYVLLWQETPARDLAADRKQFARSPRPATRLVAAVVLGWGLGLVAMTAVLGAGACCAVNALSPFAR